MVVDWSTEWFTSIVWIVGVTLAAALGTALVGWVLVRSTVWGRQFRRLAFPYFSPRGPRGVKPLLAALLVLLLTIFSVRISVLVSYANNDIFTALQKLDPAGFARGLGEFGVLATISVALALVAFYVQQRLTIRFWEWLTDTVLSVVGARQARLTTQPTTRITGAPSTTCDASSWPAQRAERSRSSAFRTRDQ